jgi:glycosyltransferase involved in cell wall biosynthesis
LSYEIVVPTKNRPERLARCLTAIAPARRNLEIPVLVGDSSDDATHPQVVEICGQYEFVTVRRHHGTNVAAARNFCAREARADVLIGVDDDIRIEPDALEELVAGYERSPKPCSIAGTVAWDGLYHEPVVLRRIGYGRPARAGEEPDFLVTALFAYPRELALALPWNERLTAFDDIFIGALWGGHGVNLCFAPRARATHDEVHQHYGLRSQAHHVYVTLFIAVWARPDLVRALCFEFLGFAAGAKLYLRTPRSAARYVYEWIRGHVLFVRDTRYLRSAVKRPLPAGLSGEPESP